MNPTIKCFVEKIAQHNYIYILRVYIYTLNMCSNTTLPEWSDSIKTKHRNTETSSRCQGCVRQISKLNQLQEGALEMSEHKATQFPPLLTFTLRHFAKFLPLQASAISSESRLSDTILDLSQLPIPYHRLGKLSSEEAVLKRMEGDFLTTPTN